MDSDFSQRMGFVPAQPVIQLDNIDEPLKVALWNVLTCSYLQYYRPKLNSAYRKVSGSNRQSFAENYYARIRKQPIDELPSNWSDFLGQLKHDFLKVHPWHKVYSVIEFMVSQVGVGNQALFVDELNQALEREGSGYRIVGGHVTPITSSAEIDEVVEAMRKGDKYLGIGEHLSASVRLLSDKQNPDYRNSIKESISAVESLARELTGNPNAMLGAALGELEKHHDLHPALKKAFASLYGWTSDAGGIRHALMEASTLTQADARFMLITCSAFINFAIDTTKEWVRTAQ